MSPDRCSSDTGTGDYTKERRQWLSNDLDEICKEIQEMQNKEP